MKLSNNVLNTILNNTELEVKFQEGSDYRGPGLRVVTHKKDYNLGLNLKVQLPVQEEEQDMTDDEKEFVSRMKKNRKKTRKELGEAVLEIKATDQEIKIENVQEVYDFFKENYEVPEVTEDVLLEELNKTRQQERALSLEEKIERFEAEADEMLVFIENEKFQEVIEAMISIPAFKDHISNFVDMLATALKK